MVVDLSDRCIAACRDRFAADGHIEYITNDGASLDMVPDHSVDFIFSFDSLVHAEADAVSAYLAEAARKLKQGGAGFVHHSNLGAFVHPRTGRVRRFVTSRNWRAESMSADVFQQACSAAGLTCRSQELINWIGRGRTADRHHLDGRCIPLTDCLSSFSTPERNSASPRVIANHAFVDEWRQAIWIAEVYLRSADEGASSAAAAAASPRSFRQKIATARAVRQRHGLRGVAALAWQQTIAGTAFTMSALNARMMGAANRWFERRHLTDRARLDSPVQRD